jgi:trimeric intracellular cation channel
VATVLLILQMRGFLSVPFAIVYFGVVLFLVYFDIAAQVIGTHDPFVPMENIICAVFFGGLVDSLRRVTTGGGTSRPLSGDEDKKTN